MTSAPKSLRPLFDALHAIRLPLAILVLCSVALNSSSSAQAAGPQGATARQIGTVKSISGNNLTIRTDSGSDAQVVVEESARILRASPGQKTLQEATPAKLEDIQVSDRVLARGTAGADSQSVQASLVVIMKQTEVSQKQEQEREDWQKHGIGGLITAVDPSTGTITVSVAPNYTVAVKTSSQTVFLRYAPESVKFADATRGTFDQIKNGDQLRARGTRSADGKELAAEEVVSGSFRNIAGTILAVDATKNTLSVMDLLKKKPVTVKFSSDSQLRKLPQMAAVRIAAMLKGRGQEGQAGGPATLGSPGTTPPANQVRTAPPGGRGPGEGPAGDARPGAMQRAGGGAPDFQQVIGRLPAVTLNDLQKGDAVMIVSTEGSATSDPKAITLLSGVEPILTASPNGASAAFLSAWNIGGGEGGPQ